MTAVRLEVEPVIKPWGRRDLAPWSDDLPCDAAPVGEMIHRPPLGQDAAGLLVKTIFTSERLSVQVHPTDAAAPGLGLPHGKDEAWIVLAADPGATIGFGLKQAADAATVRAAALAGTIVEMLDWRPVAPGDAFYVPAGTIHAIGGGVTLLEVQQNIDVTYRLYDYGRDRPLQLDAALAVACFGPAGPLCPPRDDHGRAVLIDGGKFVVERVALDGVAQLSPVARCPVRVAVVGGSGRIDGMAMRAGEVWTCDAAARLDGTADLIVAYGGGAVAAGLWTQADALATPA